MMAWKNSQRKMHLQGLIRLSKVLRVLKGVVRPLRFFKAVQGLKRPRLIRALWAL